MIDRSLEDSLFCCPKRKRSQGSSKAGRRMRLYWRIVEKENRDRPRRKRPKHFRKRIVVETSTVF